MIEPMGSVREAWLKSLSSVVAPPIRLILQEIVNNRDIHTFITHSLLHSRPLGYHSSINSAQVLSTTFVMLGPYGKSYNHLI